LYLYRPQGGGRGPAAKQEGSRDLFVNKKNLFARTLLAGACRPAGGKIAVAIRCVLDMDTNKNH